ncbi:MAG: sporulation protein [Chitinophaga sp.]|jgi:SPOR domain|nr:sporulation protein [Chitinophaga sp.]
MICLSLLAKISFASSDTIIIHKDPRLDLLSAKQALLNKRASMITSAGMYKGFRLQVISTNSRDEAIRIKTDLLVKFPDQKVYLTFQSPSFKVRIGNFLKKDDAENFRNILSKYYPSGVYVVADAIEYSPKEEEESPNP